MDLGRMKKKRGVFGNAGMVLHSVCMVSRSGYSCVSLSNMEVNIKRA